MTKLELKLSRNPSRRNSNKKKLIRWIIKVQSKKLTGIYRNLERKITKKRSLDGTITKKYTEERLRQNTKIGCLRRIKEGFT